MEDSGYGEAGSTRSSIGDTDRDAIRTIVDKFSEIKTHLVHFESIAKVRENRHEQNNAMLSRGFHPTTDSRFHIINIQCVIYLTDIKRKD